MKDRFQSFNPDTGKWIKYIESENRPIHENQNGKPCKGVKKSDRDTKGFFHLRRR